jgi:hypothetical protein
MNPHTPNRSSWAIRSIVLAALALAATGFLLSPHRVRPNDALAVGSVTVDPAPDTDNDGIANYADGDVDGDGNSNASETGAT